MICFLTHWPLGDAAAIFSNFESNIKEKYPDAFFMELLRWVRKDLTDDLVNTDSGNGLVPSGNKPLPGPVFTKSSDAIWCH